MLVRYVSEASALLLTPCANGALVSITEPGREAPLPSPDAWGALLRIQFADAEYDNGTIARLQARGKMFDAESKGFPCGRSARALHVFLDDVAGRPGIDELTVHCHAGKRRSAAVAKFASERFSADFDHGYADYNKTVYALLQDPQLYEFSKPQPLTVWGRLFGKKVVS
jgi:predicted protein tyrosine phosphatase